MKTNQKATQAALELLESAAIAHSVVNDRREVVWANKTLQRFLGISVSDLISSTVDGLIDRYGEDVLYNLQEFKAVMSEALRRGKTIEGFEMHIRPGEGRQERWLEFWSFPIESGEYAGGRMDHFYDITASKQAKENLKLLTTAVEQGSEGIAIIKLDGSLLFANDAFAEMHGYTIDEILGSHIQNFRVSENNISFENDLNELRELGSLSHESWHVKKSGERFPVNIVVSLVRDSDGKPNSILNTCRDITEWKRSEEELRESRRVLSTLMSNLPGMAYRCENNPEWTMEFVSDGCLALTGYRAEELLHNRELSYNDLIHIDDREPVWEQVQTAVQERKAFTLNYRIQTKSGKVKWVWEQGRGGFDDDKLLFLEGFVADITERKRVEEALLESEAKFRRLAETTNALIFIYQHQRLVYANPAAANATGYSFQDISRMDFWDIIHPDMREEVRRRGCSHAI